MNVSSAVYSSSIFASHSGCPAIAPVAEPRITGVSSPGNSYWLNSSRTSSSTRSSSSASSTRSHLFRNTTTRRHVHLPRQQDVLPRLRHRPVRRRHHQDRPVHLRRPRDHVLHVVGVPRTVHVRVVPLLRLVLHVARRDRQDLRRVPPPLRLRRLRHLVVRRCTSSPTPCPPTPSSAPPSASSSRGPRARSSRRSRAASSAQISPSPWSPCPEIRLGRFVWAERAETSRLTSPLRPLRPLRPSHKLATGIEPVTSSLPRMRSTD